MKKRVLSMLMALALCLTLLPAPAWAEEDTPEGGAIVQEEQQEKAPAAESPTILEQAAENGIAAQNGGDSTVENAVAEVTIDGTTTQYANIDAAFAAAQQAGSATVKLLTDVTTTSEIEVDSGTFTIDLNGKKLDRTSPFTLSVKENGNVTVTSTQGTGTISNAQNTAIFVNNGATVHVTKGVRLNQLYTMKNAKLTLDVGVIITVKFFTQADNIAPFLAGKALQSCDENGTLIEGQYKSIYDSYRMDDTGCVIVIEHKSCTGTPSTETPCPICGYDGTQTKPTEPENPNPDVAEVNGTKYKTLAEAIKAANGADITLLTIVSENVVVDGASIKAGVILGNGATINAIPYPSNWVADRNGIPLTMEAGEITLKDGALAQFSASSSANVAIALKGGTLIVEKTVTKIIGSNRSDSVQHAAIEVTGGVLALQGNTLLDGGLTMSGDAQLKNKLTAGTFTNSGSETYSVSIEGSSQYTTVFDLLETGYAFAEYNADNEGDTTGAVIVKDDRKSLTEDVAVIKCTHKDANNKSLFKDNTCTGCGFTCAHETVENGICTVCKQQMKAKAIASDGAEKYYLELQEAFEGVADGGTVTMLTTLTDDDTISFCCDAEGKPVEKTVTLMMNGQSLSFEGASPLHIQSGKLIIGDEAAISQPAQAAVPAVFVDNNEQSKDRGTLEFKGKANLTGGLLIQNWGKLVGGLKEGTIITSNGTYSVSVERSETYSNVLGLLGDGLAFAKKDHPDELVNGNVKQLTEDVIVVAHKHSPKYTQNPDPDALQTYIYICDCGFVCPHDRFTNSICDICHAACTHDEYTSDDKCARCGAPFAVQVECTDSVGITSNKLYMKTTTQDGTDDTLRQVFNEAADGSTITLLANGMLPSGIYASKTLTLDLNGHSLSGYSLNVGGLTPTSQVRTGNLTVIDSSGGNGAVGVTVRDGGTLVFDPKNDSTTLLQLEVWGGTVELYGGKISRSGLRLNNSITLGDLLPGQAGLAYYRGDTQLTLEEAASKTCDLVVKSCSHGGKNGFDENAAACPYCNALAVAETALYNSEGNRPQRRFANLQTAIDADRDGGAELTLLADVTGNYTIDGTKVTGLDLNGHSIKGTVTVKGTLTTTLSNTKNTTTVSIDAVVAYKGAKLGGSKYPAVIGKLTLADTTQWKDILQQPTRLGFGVTNADGTRRWYAPEGVNGSQLNNVIINSLPITRKNLAFKVNGTNVKGNKVERGTTVQLCADCNTKDATVEFSILKKGETTPITLSGNDVKYTTVGTGTTKFYVAEYTFNDVGSYTISFTAAKDGYSVQSGEKKLTVTKAAIPASAITAPAANALTYNGNKQELVTAGSVNANYGEMQYRLGASDGFSTAIPTATDAGTYTVWYRVIGNANHNDTAPASVVVSIGKKPLTLTEVTAVSKPYDGTTNAGITSVTFDGVTLIRGTDYNVTASFEDASVGNNKKVTAAVTLTGQTAKNYALEQSSFPTTGSITKAAAPDFTRETALVIVNDCEKTYTVTLPTLPTLETPKEYGAPTYELGEIKLNGGYYTGGAKVENGKLTLPIQKNDVETTGSVGTVTVVIKSTNYENITLTVNVSAKNKLTPVLTGTLTLTPTEITYGEPLSKIKITGTMQDPITGDEVNGTFAWKDDTIKPAANDSYEAEWTFTPNESYGGIYATATGIVKVPVSPKSIEGATITLEKYEFAYNAAEQSPRITGVTLENWDETRITYVIKSGDKATDVSDSITLTIEGTGNYTGRATVKWKITPKTVTPTIEVAACTYTGDALEPTVTLKDDIGNIIDPKEYEIFYSNNTNAGTATVTIKDVDGGNYVLSEASKTFEITKAAAPAAEAGSLTITNGLHKTYSLDLSTLLPKLTAPCDYGTIIYDKKVDAHLGVGTFVTLVNGKAGELTLEANRSGTDEGQFGTITVTISTSNYQDITLTIHVSAKNKLTPVLAGTLTLTPTEITYGEPLSKIKITGTMKAGDTVVEGTFAWQQPGDTILDASTSGHDVGWKFTPKDGNTYTEATGTATVKVDKAQQYGKVSMAGYTYGQAPSTPTLTDRTGDLNAQVTYGYAAAGSGSVQTWDIQNPPALNAGTYRMYASIGDTDNYYGFEAVYCEFVVAKATPAYTAPTGLTAKYGQTLADVKLSNPEGNLDGTWSWMNSSESVGNASTATKTFQAKFTPTDTDNYNMVENIELEVLVNKADGRNLKTVELEQKYTDASEHTYTPDWPEFPSGQTWRYSSEYSVSTGSNVTLTKQDFVADGSLLTYAVSGGKAGDKITLTLKASCDNYGDFTITLNIPLTEKDDQKPLTITGDISVIYGEKLTLTTTGGSGTGAVTYRIDTAHSNGGATIDPNTGVLTPVKVGSVSVIATKAGNNDYNDVTSVPFVLMVKPATPTGKPKYTEITTSGKTLADAALTTEGSTLNPTDGKLEWVDDKDNVLPGSTGVNANTTYKWRFTPTNTNYTTLTGEIELYRKSSSGGGGWYYSYYTIKATAGAGGSISPSGDVSVREGGDQTFTITPDKGYAVANVKIDGKRIGAVKSYTFENVRRTHTIEVIFVKGTASASTGDSSNLPLWSALLLASTLTLAGAVHYKRKRAR